MTAFDADPRTRIIAIDCFHFALPFTTGGPQMGFRPSLAARPWVKLECVHVRIRTADGLEGWGEAFGNMAAAGTMTTLASVVAPWFLGQPADRHGALIAEARKAFMSFGRSGPVLYALSGLDIALWDLTAQRAGKPLWALLGGNGAPLTRYASLMRYGGDLDAVARNATRYRDLGYETIKIHEVTVEAFRTAATAAGGAGRVMIDVNCTWTPNQASEILTMIAGEDYFWIEEPIWPTDDHGAMARTAALGQKLAAGENAASTADLIDMASDPVFAYVQPSVAKIGGISEMLHLLAAVGAGGNKLFPHAFYCGPAYLATAHLLSGWPVPVPLETAAVEFEALPHDQYDPRQPTFTFPERPGLGYCPNSSWLSRHLVSRAEINAH